MENSIKAFLSTVIFFTFLLINLGSTTTDFGYSAYCQKCLSPCEWYKGEKQAYFWCKTDNWTLNGSVYNWDYCSQNATTEFKGRSCSSVCAFHGESYQWCTTMGSLGGWGFCSGKFCDKSFKMELPDYGVSANCQTCLTPCRKTSAGIHGCGTRKWIFENKTWVWDFCSPENGVDYMGKKCLGECKLTEVKRPFQWCTTEKNGTGGFCSLGKGSTC